MKSLNLKKLMIVLSLSLGILSPQVVLAKTTNFQDVTDSIDQILDDYIDRNVKNENKKKILRMVANYSAQLINIWSNTGIEILRIYWEQELRKYPYLDSGEKLDDMTLISTILASILMKMVFGPYPEPPKTMPPYIHNDYRVPFAVIPEPPKTPTNKDLKRVQKKLKLERERSRLLQSIEY